MNKKKPSKLHIIDTALCTVLGKEYLHCRGQTWKKIIYVKYQADLQSKINSIFTNSLNMRDIGENITQYDRLYKYSK